MHFQPPIPAPMARMIYRSTISDDTRAGSAEEQEEVERLREENRRLSVSLGAFSAFIASKGLLDEAWHFIHNMYQLEDGERPD